MRKKILPGCVALLLLTACAPTQKQSKIVYPADAALNTSPAKDTMSDRESCVHACEADYVRCGDQSAAQRDGNSGFRSGGDLFGAAATCKESLKNCLPRCKGR